MTATEPITDSLIITVSPLKKKILIVFLLILQVLTIIIAGIVFNNDFHSAFEFKMVYMFPIDVYCIWSSLKYVIPGQYYLKLTTSGLDIRMGKQLEHFTWNDIERFELYRGPLTKVILNARLNRSPIIVNGNWLSIRFTQLPQVLTQWKNTHTQQ